MNIDKSMYNKIRPIIRIHLVNGYIKNRFSALERQKKQNTTTTLLFNTVLQTLYTQTSLMYMLLFLI